MSDNNPKHSPTASKDSQASQTVDNEFETQMIEWLENQILLISMKQGNKLAAKIFVGELADRILNGRSTPIDMIHILDILKAINKKDLAQAIMSDPRSGSNPRNPHKCVEVYLEVTTAKKKYDIPIKLGRYKDNDKDKDRKRRDRFKIDTHQPDALSQVAKDRENRQVLPWQYSTVKKYYDDGRKYHQEAFKNMKKANAFLRNNLSKSS
jgi:hypothetical protein